MTTANDPHDHDLSDTTPPGPARCRGGRFARGAFLVLGIAVLALLHAPEPARAQVSPGPLAAPHAALDGTTACFNCHQNGTGKAGMDQRCLDCHTEVGWMRSNHRGFHARKATLACASCHPDHGGRAFALVAWDGGAPEKFDHAQAGFVLEGKHGSLACRDCHKPALQRSPATPLLRVKDHTRSWLGLETTCVSCHRDVHENALGQDCASCHSQIRWSPAPGFDHARTKYALTGAHQKPACAACHATAAVNSGRDAKGAWKPRWKPVAHDDCVSCHKDPHSGRFKGACAKCHVTSEWKAVNRSGFDHEQTKYPLRGAHANVKCEGCHEPRFGGQRPKFARCMDCHKDAHQGTATVAGKPTDCATCHDVKAFAPSIWPVAEHQRTKYPLDGAHANTACGKCHTRAAERSSEAALLGPARVRMRPARGACVDCHSDPHAGRFSPGGLRPHQAACLACHSMSAFQPSTYDGRAHADCVFPLEGAHMAVPCQKCHAELDKAPGGSTLKGSTELRALKFDSKARICKDCHDDTHHGQFAVRKDKGACEACHDFNTFIGARKFDHDRDSEFRLQGAHARTPCAACHRNGRMSDGYMVVVYRPTPSRCEQCHAPASPDATAPGGTASPPRDRKPRSRVQSRNGR